MIINKIVDVLDSDLATHTIFIAFMLWLVVMSIGISPSVTMVAVVMLCFELLDAYRDYRRFKKKGENE